MTEAARNQVLEALRLGREDFYEIGVGPDGFWARRRDGLGETMTAEDPGELLRQVDEDYALMPRRAMPLPGIVRPVRGSARGRHRGHRDIRGGRLVPLR